MKFLYIGLMTGTSLDSVDSALIEHTLTDHHSTYRYIHHVEYPMPPTLRQTMFELYNIGYNELERAAQASHMHAEVSAQSVHELLKTQQLNANDITAIGSHGQTVRHQPNATPAYTIQLQNPALLCELTHIDVIADFRRRDIAANGQGAPLAPLFHQGLLNIKQGCVVNIGGIANISIIDNEYISGYDSGPGNGLLDNWIEKHRQLPYDNQGQWAKTGQIIDELLTSLLNFTYFSQPAPKSSGRDHFNMQWLSAYLKSEYQAVDVQRTLLELTAKSIANAVNESIAKRNWSQKSVILVGGGAKNSFLVARIQTLLDNDIQLKTSTVPEQAIEAAGFAWLAAQYCQGIALPLTNITGAKGSRLLGAWYRA